MANVLGLALKISADASGVQKSLTPVEKAFQQLDTQAKTLTDAFKQFESSSSGAGAAQQKLATDFAFLNSALRTGQIDARKYAEEFALLEKEARATSEAFAEGARLTEANRTAEEKRAAELKRLDDLLQLGAISQETFNRAAAEASGANKAAAEAEAAAAKARADLAAEAARITASVVTEQEKRQAFTDRLNTLLRDGLITEETYTRAVYEGSEAQAKSAAAERERLDVVARGKALAEQFATAEERRARQLEEVDRLLKANAISEETAARARAEFGGLNAARIEAEKELAAATEEAAKRIAKAESLRSQAIASASRIIEANLTPQERYDNQMQELNTHLLEGRLSQEQFNRAAAKAEQDLNGVAKEATKTDEKIEKLNNNVSLLAKIEIGRLIFDGLQALGSVFTQVSSQITSLVSSVNGSIDTLSDFSARTGIGVEALQGYSLAAKLAGVDTEQFGAAVQKLGVSIGKSAPGDAFDKSLQGINLSVRELRALSPEQQFSAIGQAISQLPTAADRAAAAVKIFGEQGAALAPLFREGAASIEELKARAERLGIIVSETQVNNVADMNDAFDLVRATIEGIVGQVIGNLAPAVTEVTNQFLKFVEEWSGAQGTGGTGIANAITDVLLQGAEYFAGIFDEFVANFGSLGETFSFAADVFDVTSKILLTASEGIRAAFNAVQIGIDALLIGFGKIVEALGSYVSNDLEQFGAGLAAASQESADRNAREMEAAAANAANTFNSIFNGGQGNAEAAGQGAASQYLRGLRNEIANARLPEVQLQTNVDTLRERFDVFFNGIVDHSSKVTAAMREFEALLAAAQQDGELTTEEIANIEQAQARVNDLIDQEIAARQESAATAAAQAEADRKRIDTLLGASDAAAKLEQDLQAVQREQARVSAELAAARAADNQAQADAAAARQGELDQLQASLEEQQQALEQGFSQGFQAAFDNVNQNIDGLIAKSQQFGQAGFDAALRLQEGIAAAQQQAQAGILNQEAFNAEVQRQRSIFEERLAQIEQQRQAEQQAKAAVFQLEVDANQRVNEFIAQRTQAEVAAAEQAAARRQQAAFNIEAIEQRIALERQSLEAAREQNDMNAARAAVQRIDLLKDALSVEQQIADGREQELQKQQQLIENQQQFQRQQQAAVQAYQQQQQQAQQAYAQEQARIFEEQRKAAEAEAKRQEERITALNTLGSTTIKSQDVRSTEGANLVLQTIANGQDPALIQQRLQTKYLEAIALGIGQASNNYFNQPVAIVGYSSFGQR